MNQELVKSTSVIKVAIMTIQMIPVTQMKPSHVPQNQHLLLSVKMNGTQRRIMVSSQRMHCKYCGMLKGTSQAEAMSNSEKNQAHSLSHYRVTLSHSVVNSVKIMLFNSVATF